MVRIKNIYKNRVVKTHRGVDMGNIEKFDFVASGYDTAERIEIANIVADEIRKHIIDGNVKDAIDYGCGTGLVGLRLLDNFKSILFVDASKNMINQVKHKIDMLQAKNAEITCSDFISEYPQNLKADYIIIVQVLLHEKDIRSLLTCLFSILNKDGHLLIVDFDKNANVVSNEVHNGFEQQKLANILREISFSYVKSKTFYHGKKIFMNQDASLFILDAIK